MHWLLWVALCIIFGIGYRVGYKVVSTTFTPFLNIAIITAIVSVTCFVAWLIKDFPKEGLPLITPKTLITLLIVGLIMAGLEISIMHMYRSGAPLSISQSLASGSVGIAVFTIGVYFFKENLNFGQIIGFVLGLSGIILMTYHSYK